VASSLTSIHFRQNRKTRLQSKEKEFVFYIEQVRKKLADAIISEGNYFVIDAMLLKVCKMSRSNRSTICKDDYNCVLIFGCCVSQDIKYYGFKLHSGCSLTGVFKSLDLTSANVYLFIVLSYH